MKNNRFSLILILLLILCACTSSKDPVYSIKGVRSPDPIKSVYEPLIKSGEAQWNSWTEDNSGNLADTLYTNKSYKAKLDISPYVYRTFSSAPITAPLLEYINNAIHTGETELHFTVRVILMGSELEFVGPNNELTLSVNLNTFRKAATPESINSATEDLRDILKDSSRLPEIAKKLGAGSLSVPVRVVGTTGCAQIAYTIWDESGKRPFDHIVYSAPINDAKTCTVQRLQGGFASLAGPLSSNLAPKIDAALHIFQFQTAKGVGTSALYVDVEKYKSSFPNASLAERGIYSWNLQSNMVDYVGGELQAQIDYAREHKDYSRVIKKLQLKFFPYSPLDTTDGGARSAFESLLNLKSTFNSAPTLLVRFITDKGDYVYAPLAMLAAHKGSQKQLNIVYPLPRENYANSNCIDHWTIGYPKALDDLNDVALDDSKMDQLIAGQMHRLHNLQELQCYLNPPKKPDACSGKTTKSEALLLLAHQGNGNFWFTEEEGDLTLEENNRQFSPGSVAFISACSTANPTGTNQKIMERFNKNGVDAMVLSPFQVPADYGRFLTLAALKVVREAYEKKETPTLMEIFENAAQAVKTDLKAQAAKTIFENAARAAKTDLVAQAALTDFKLHKDDPDYRRLEFVVVGNHEIRLCRRKD